MVQLLLCTFYCTHKKDIKITKEQTMCFFFPPKSNHNADYYRHCLMKLTTIGCTRIVITFTDHCVVYKAPSMETSLTIWFRKTMRQERQGIPYLYFPDEETQIWRSSDLIMVKQRVPGGAEVHLGLMNLRHVIGSWFIIHLVGMILTFSSPGTIPTKAYSNVQGETACTCILSQQLLVRTQKRATGSFWALYLIRTCVQLLPHKCPSTLPDPTGQHFSLMAGLTAGALRWTVSWST